MKYHGAWFAAVITGLIPVGPLPAGAETIAVFTKSAGNPISRAVRAGAEAVAKANGVTVFHYIPTSADNVPQQTALVDEALSAKRDAIVFTPVDVKAMVPVVQKINAANIPLVNVSDRLAGGSAVAFIGTDDYGIALETARTLLKAMGGKPQVDGVLAANDAMAFGVIEAFKEAKKKPPLIVGINASKEAVDFIKAGDMLASGDYNGLIEGCLGAEIAIRTLHKQPVPKEVLAKTAVVDKTNYQAYEIPAERRPCPTLESMAAK